MTEGLKRHCHAPTGSPRPWPAAPPPELMFAKWTSMAGRPVSSSAWRVASPKSVSPAGLMM